MKRTTERGDLAGKQVPEFISGCRQFEGEDINYRNRQKMHQEIQKQWVNAQSQEKEAIQEAEKYEEHLYAQQTDHITRMRGMLEDEMSQKKAQQLKELQDYNKRLAEEKRQREQAWRTNQEEQNQFEISRTNASDIMTENFQTTTSKLASHRFVPYHFKGLRQDQIEDINVQREAQVLANKQANKEQKQEDYAWAVQNLAATQHFLNNEIDLAQKTRAMTENHGQQAIVDKQAKDARWPNMYGDLNPLPPVSKDMVAGANPRAIV